MRVITANVNGIRAAAKKGFFDWLKRQRADFVCLQETKAQEHQLDDSLFYPKGYHCYYFDAEKNRSGRTSPGAYHVHFILSHQQASLRAVCALGGSDRGITWLDDYRVDQGGRRNAAAGYPAERHMANIGGLARSATGKFRSHDSGSWSHRHGDPALRECRT